MAAPEERSGSTVFRPGLYRFLASEFGRAAVATALALATAFVVGGDVSVLVVGGLAGLGAAGALYHALVFRSLRYVEIGPAWIKGPCPNPVYATTCDLRGIDWSRSGVKRGALWIYPAEGGDAIKFKLRWFRPEEINEMKRLIRDRSASAHLSTDFL